MIKTTVLEEIIISALYSAYIADEKPLSLLITAEVESGKTDLVLKFKDNEKVKYLTDATAYSIWRDLSTEIQGGLIKHFIFPDLLTPFAKNKDTVNSFIMFLANLTEEGLAEVHAGFLPEGGIVLASPKPVGVIGCIARGELLDQRHKWARAGFMSRMLPISYSYSVETIDAIKKSISERVYVRDSPTKLTFPKDDVKVALPTYIADEIRKLEEEIKKKADLASEASYVYGFRMLKSLQRLVMGYTLSHGRTTVEPSDYAKLKNDFMKFINLDYVEI